jgi:hypothetical protein
VQVLARCLAAESEAALVAGLRRQLDAAKRGKAQAELNVSAPRRRRLLRVCHMRTAAAAL